MEDHQMDRFEEEYCCFSLSSINKSHLEDGNRIIMPASALQWLVSINTDYPLIFEIRNPSAGRFSHCGVLEFSAEEGFVFLPDWMMKSMRLEEGQTVSLKSTSLPKGTYVKIQPHSVKFIALSDPKDVLETSLKKFSCLTAGDTIMISHNCSQYYINIVETKPSNAISVVETDCEVEFAAPLDYKEPQKKPKSEINSKREAADKPHEEPKEPKFEPFAGVARRLDGQQPSNELAAAVGLNSVLSVPDRDGNQPERKPAKVSKEENLKKFIAFTGVSRRLDEEQQHSAVSMEQTDGPVAAAADGLNFGLRKRPGNLAFGPEDATQPESKSAKKSKEEEI